MAHNGETRKWSRGWWFLWWWRDSRHNGGEGLRGAKGEANPQPPAAVRRVNPNSNLRSKYESQ